MSSPCDGLGRGQCRARLVEAGHQVSGEVAAAAMAHSSCWLASTAPLDEDPGAVVGDDPDEVAAALHFLVEPLEWVARPRVGPVAVEPSSGQADDRGTSQGGAFSTNSDSCISVAISDRVAYGLPNSSTARRGVPRRRCVVNPASARCTWLAHRAGETSGPERPEIPMFWHPAHRTLAPGHRRKCEHDHRSARPRSDRRRRSSAAACTQRGAPLADVGRTLPVDVRCARCSSLPHP